MKTSELTGAALDWAVAKCEGADYLSAHKDGFAIEYFSYSTDWAQGGPIIERQKIGLREPHKTPDVWYGRVTADVTVFMKSGPTPLIAAMRCFVASKLGEEVEIPKELTE